ncbi:MAG: pseudouridine synthase, partial [Herbaspirillum sp.]
MQQSEIKPLDRHGVGASCTVLPDGEWPSVFEFLTQHFQNVDSSEWLARIRNGSVLDSHGKQIGLNTPYQPHTKIYYYRSLESETAIPFEAKVLYQDDYLVVADKPHFLPVTPAGRYLQQTLLVRLKRQLGVDTLAPVHRIDRETAGLVLFTIQPATRGCYHDLFRQHSVQKIYQAVAPWRADLALPLIYRS